MRARSLGLAVQEPMDLGMSYLSRRMQQQGHGSLAFYGTRGPGLDLLEAEALLCFPDSLFNSPPSGVILDDGDWGKAGIGCEEKVVRLAAMQVTDDDNANRSIGCNAVPQADEGVQANEFLAPVAPDIAALEAYPASDRLESREPVSLFSRTSPLTFSASGRQGLKSGIRTHSTDEGRTVGQPRGQFSRSVSAVADHANSPMRKPCVEKANHFDHKILFRAEIVRALAVGVLFVEARQYGHVEVAALGQGQRHEQAKHHPVVRPVEDGLVGSGANGIPKESGKGNVLPALVGRGIVGGDKPDEISGQNWIEHLADQSAEEVVHGPSVRCEEPMCAGPMAMEFVRLGAQ